jgi:NAD(P)-dependent dehydrogenase (short-subunit alcohol dehydrogenase family)
MSGQFCVSEITRSPNDSGSDNVTVAHLVHSMERIDMANRIIIYGGTGGVGGALARRCTQAGASVHLVARREDRLAQLAGELQCTYTCGDVRDDALFERVMQDAGAPCAGIAFAVGSIRIRPLQRITAADMIDDFTLNAVAAARAVQAALPALKAHGNASVVLFSSIAARRGFASHASIAMAKAAVEGLTVALAAELAPAVRVNAIAPSLLDTELGATVAASDTARTAIANMHPLSRLGTADDVASLAAHLLSADGSWMTGQIIGVDGGRSVVVK